MRQYFLLSAVGSNRPGVVAEVAKLVYQGGCNVEDSRMTLLGTHFALMVVVSAGPDLQTEDLEDRCTGLEKAGDLTVTLFRLGAQGEVRPEARPRANYELRVSGLDRSGIVFRTSELLATRGVNILDLGSRVESPPQEAGGPLFTLRAELDVPREQDGAPFREELRKLAEELSVEISLTRL